MNTHVASSRLHFCRRLLPSSIALAFVLVAMPAVVHAQVFVADYGNGTIGEYTTSGATVNASLVSGLPNPTDIAVSGSNLFVFNGGTDTIGEYTTAGVPVNASLITGLKNGAGMAVSGSNVFVSNYNQFTSTDMVAEYTTSGALVTTWNLLFPDVAGPIAASGSNLFVLMNPLTAESYVTEYNFSGVPIRRFSVPGETASITVAGNNLFSSAFVRARVGNIVSEYAPSGSLVTSGFASGFSVPANIAVLGSDVLLTNGSTIGEYTLSGAPVNASFITGLNYASGIAVVAIPEPPAWALLFGCITLMFAAARRFRIKTVA
ncbi:MAG TPA: hypothetical protein VMI53_01785 [Opitutaceae bacterium]|nr:hypothetical protein [Opitutaceae bacterium]